MLQRYPLIVALAALASASMAPGFAQGQPSLQQTQQQLASQREADAQLALRLAVQAGQERLARAEAERTIQREAVERTEREMRARQVEELRQAEERGNQERREQAEAERRREARQREEEWRAEQARQQTKVEEDQSPDVQQMATQQTALSDEAKPVTPTVSPTPALARFPFLRLGLALFAAAIVFLLGWSLIPVLSSRDWTPGRHT